MYRKKTPGWLKHWDFELLDIVGMEISFFLAYFLRYEGVPNIDNIMYTKTALNLVIINIIVVFFLQSYKNILVRDKWQEAKATFQHVTIVQMSFLLYEYVVKDADNFSRIVFFGGWGISLIICYFIRIVLKKYVRNRLMFERPQNKMLVITTTENINQCLVNIHRKEFREFEVVCVAVLEDKGEVENKYNIPCIYGTDAIVNYIRKSVVDEVLLDSFQSKEVLHEWIELFLGMGITVHIGIGDLPEHMPNKLVGKIGAMPVVTTSIKIAEEWELVIKRVIDIVGGVVGVIIMGIAYIFVAPAIKKASPGPVFFKQARVGKNGRIFYIYKFRSMYMDAENRKKELMKYNEMQGLMFKMENDPRIIGSEKGDGKGIGNFIRKTSIDELPQFWNILKGDMSLVGTRPPTVGEYEQYELHHKIRLSTMPGLTGLWQTSGRSDITDFETIVKLDTEYIENWSLILDVKLILKTIKVVLDRTGSK